MTTLVDRVAGFLENRSNRRGFLGRVAVVGSALAVGPVDFLLKPGTAYASVCGSDTACATGYTVFCVTVNNGVNRCPPGSLVGGWWKSDGAAFCCGNARYYIDCHSYCSCGCGPGTQFCGEGCRNCSCGCGPAGQCDQRRVCCNQFRYGQCNQDVGCTGPVWCRVVTCTPPWTIPAWKCTSTSAVDQRTNDHSAPGLIDCSAINGKYWALGGQGSLLGEATTGELTTPDRFGRYTHYDNGSIYWTPNTGAWSVLGAIYGRWAALGWEAGPLGYPVTDEVGTPDRVGRFNHFAGRDGFGASIYWTPATGAWSVHGAIRAHWADLGWETSALGYPVTDEVGTPDGVGRFNHFQNGSIYWTPGTGACAVQGLIHRHWADLGWETSALGYPVTDETGTPDGVGRFNHFQNGSIYWTGPTGAHAVLGAIHTHWASLGWERSALGYPVTDELAAPGGVGRYSDFQHGSIYWSSKTGAHAVTGPIRDAWLSRGGSSGQLGLPTNNAAAAGTGRVRQDFQHGYAVLDTATGTVTITMT
jgi:uncharacterized protein with LGFP repeats